MSSQFALEKVWWKVLGAGNIYPHQSNVRFEKIISLHHAVVEFLGSQGFTKCMYILSIQAAVPK